MTLCEKSAYLRGLADGMELDLTKPENKLLSEVVDLLLAFAEENDELSWSYFVGFHILTKELEGLGEIEAVDESTINTLFIVRRLDGSELLIPAQEAFITEMDHKLRTITMDLPEGMIE